MSIPTLVCRVTVVCIGSVLVGCGSPTTGTQAAPTPTPTALASATPAPVSAKSVAAQPADFAPQRLTVCPGPETGDLAGFAAAYRVGIPYHDLVVAAAALAAQANAETWVAALAAPDAKPEVCHGALGFGYAPRQQGKEPDVTSIIVVFKDAASAQSLYPQVQANLVPHPTKTGDSTGLGANSALTDSGDAQLLIWQRGRVVSYLLTQDVDNWMSGCTTDSG